MIDTQHNLCRRGYGGTDRREPNDGSRRPMKVGTRCAEPPSQSNARGAQNAPRAGANYRSPVAGYYDPDTGKFRWADDATLLGDPGSVASRSAADPEREEAWKWLLLQPLARTAPTTE
jgi:phospholipid/cholesterol/gamma-HCH transport system substrate-binding protein